MLRVQNEQGAPAGFAQKAYQAQQAYLAEMAFDEYQAYQRLQSKNHSKLPPHPRRLPPATSRLNPGSTSKNVIRDTNIAPASYSGPTTGQNQTGYVPPVHVRPKSPGVSMSFGDTALVNPARQTERSQQNIRSRQAAVQPTSYYSSERTSVQQAAFQSSSVYQPPRQKPAQAARPLPKSPVSLPPKATLNTQVPQQRVAQLPVPSSRYPASQNANQRRRVSAPVVKAEPDFPFLPPQKVHSPSDPYVLGENPVVGLQDRIAAMLSKPRYRELAGNEQPIRTGMRNMGERIGMRTPQTVSVANPPQQLVRNSTTQVKQPRVEKTPAIGTQVPPRKAEREPDVYRDLDVKLASEMAKRIRNSTRSVGAGVQQVAMVEPAQDPFNDSNAYLEPTLDGPVTSRDAVSQSSFQDRFPRGIPARPISILSNQDQDDGSFPVPDTSAPDSLNGSLGQKSDAELDQYDQELNRRLKEMEEQARKDAEEKAQLDDLSKGIAGSSQDDLLEDDSLDSIMDDKLEEPRDSVNKPQERSCEEFRTELLTSSIRDISLDISPKASSIRDQYMAISRSWTDRMGNIIATGSMVDLRRGYVIIDGVDGRQKIPYGKLSDADWAAISDYWKIPALCSVGNGVPVSRNWVPQTYTWKASSLCHKPLFFENIQLERYGHSRGPFAQPVHSVAHFFASLIKVPYHSAITPANECQYALGFYRPGNCAPWLIEPTPISLDGVKRQALWVTSGAFIP